MQQVTMRVGTAWSVIRDRRLRGQLELAWTTRDQRLLAHGEDTYERTTPADYRVSEVLLLHDVATVGETHEDTARAKDNLLRSGDAFHALTALKEAPEFAAEYRGKVRLASVLPNWLSVWGHRLHGSVGTSPYRSGLSVQPMKGRHVP